MKKAFICLLACGFAGLLFGERQTDAESSTNAPPEVRNVRIISPRLTISRKTADSAAAYVSGQIRVDMSFAKATVRKPVLRLVCLCEVDGSLVCYQGFWDRPRTYSRLDRSEIMKAFKNAGIEPKYKNREAVYNDLSKVTCCLCEGSRDTYAAAVYGEKSVDKGFFRLGNVAAKAKILAYRIEIWQNGSQVGCYDSPRTGLGRYNLPEDWTEWKKYPEKFRYVDNS